MSWFSQIRDGLDDRRIFTDEADKIHHDNAKIGDSMIMYSIHEIPFVSLDSDILTTAVSFSKKVKNRISSRLNSSSTIWNYPSSHEATSKLQIVRNP